MRKFDVFEKTFFRTTMHVFENTPETRKLLFDIFDYAKSSTTAQLNNTDEPLMDIPKYIPKYIPKPKESCRIQSGKWYFVSHGNQIVKAKCCGIDEEQKTAIMLFRWGGLFRIPHLKRFDDVKNELKDPRLFGLMELINSL